MTKFEDNIVKGRYLLSKKHRFNLPAQTRIVSCDRGANALMCIGQSNGVFSLYNLNTLESIHSFQITEQKIDSISINSTGDWIALASKMEGQLFVWEWKSETYVLKQQGHFFDLNCIAYSPDGAYLATGGDDGKVKCWTTKNALCFTTFNDHQGSITDIKFMPRKGNAIITCSVDGTVRRLISLSIRISGRWYQTSPHNLRAQQLRARVISYAQVQMILSVFMCGV